MTDLGPGAEFDAIRAMLTQWGPVARGIGDDAALLDVPPGSRVLASTDTAVEDVHFRRQWLTPTDIGWRAAQAAMSDIAAMGAAPMGILVALIVPQAWRSELAGIAAGIREAAEAARTHIIGGDLSDGAKLTLAITALGHAPRPLERTGAKPGDTLYVTGTLGGPGAAVAALERGATPTPEQLRRFARPEARLAAGQWLAAHGAHAALDISDGLVGDVRHLAAASGVRCVVNVDALPCVAGVTSMEAFASGEEYELLIAAPAHDAASAEAFVQAFAKAHDGLTLTAIGRVEAAAPGHGEVVATLGGTDVPLGAAYDHFHDHVHHEPHHT